MDATRANSSNRPLETGQAARGSTGPRAFVTVSAGATDDKARPSVGEGSVGRVTSATGKREQRFARTGGERAGGRASGGSQCCTAGPARASTRAPIVQAAAADAASSLNAAATAASLGRRRDDVGLDPLPSSLIDDRPRKFHKLKTL